MVMKASLESQEPSYLCTIVRLRSADTVEKVGNCHGRRGLIHSGH